MNIALPLEIVNNMPWVWLTIAILMTIVEGLTMGLTTIWLALAALCAMILSFFIPSIPAQIIVFLILAILMIFFTRPLAVKKLNLGSEKTNADRLVGMKGIVTVRVTMDQVGQVKVGGQIWTARPENRDTIHEEGEEVEILKIEGVTLTVAKSAE